LKERLCDAEWVGSNEFWQSAAWVAKTRRMWEIKVNSEPKHYFRGTVLLLTLGPICLVSFAIAALTILEMLISSWNPSNWFSDSGVDWLFGAGGKGDGERFLKFMVFGVVGAATSGVIRWGYQG